MKGGAAGGAKVGGKGGRRTQFIFEGQIQGIYFFYLFT